ncbi:N-acetyltransferase Eco1p [Diutina catenulata]
MKGKDIQHAPTKRRRQVQMIFGGTPNNPTLISTCRECSMKYHKHVPAEVKLHKAFHDEATKGPMIRFTPAHRLEEWTQSGPSGRATVSAFVLSKDTKSEVTLGEKIMKIVNSELGATDDDDQWKNPTKKDSKAFAIVADKRVVAMVTTNAPSEGHWMVYRTQHLVPNQVNKTVRMGISRIWVCSSWRRRGLGSKLLDLVQRFATEKVLSPHEIAFSQPSEAGRHLSKNFNGVPHKSGEVLIPVYND